MTVERVQAIGNPAISLRELYMGEFCILESGFEKRTVEDLETMLPATSAALLDKSAFPSLEIVRVGVKGNTRRHAEILKTVFEELMFDLGRSGVLQVDVRHCKLRSLSDLRRIYR